MIFATINALVLKRLSGRKFPIDGHFTAKNGRCCVSPFSRRLFIPGIGNTWHIVLL